MDKKDIELTCPCCDSRLTVDLRTGKVVRARRPEELDETGKPRVSGKDWERMNSAVQGRLESASSKFDAGLARERSKARDLDDLFKQAKKRVSRGEDDTEGES